MADEAQARGNNRLLAKAKREAAALLLGAPFYGIVIALTLPGWSKLAALAVYGVVTGAWVAGRGRRALVARAESAPG